MQNRRESVTNLVWMFVKTLGVGVTVTLASCAPPGTALQNYARDGVKPPEYYKNFDNWENSTDDVDGDVEAATGNSNDDGHTHDEPTTAVGKSGPDEKEEVANRGCQAAAHRPCFPIAGPARFRNDYGASRGGGKRRHAGNDIFAAKLTPVIAIDDGVVDTVLRGGGLSGAYVGINHGNGVRTLYMHLNNDTPGTNDGRGQGIVPGIRVGSRVKKGQQIGWVGNSGNAERTSPHLHFEMRVSQNKSATKHSAFYPVNPFRMLKDAESYKAKLPHAARYRQ